MNRGQAPMVEQEGSSNYWICSSSSFNIMKNKKSVLFSAQRTLPYSRHLKHHNFPFASVDIAWEESTRSRAHQNLPNHPSHMKMLSRFLSDERSSLLNRAINFREIEWSETIFLLTHFQYFCILHFLFSETGQPNSSSKESSRRHPTAKLSFMRLVNVFGKMTRERKGKMDIIIKVINLKSPQSKRKLEEFSFRCRLATL